MTQAVAEKAQNQTAPYVSYKTFKSFVESLKVGLPGRIDRSILHSMSGGVQKHLIHSLRAMGLVSQHEVPTESLKRLVSADGAERQRALVAALKTGYPFLFDESIDLASASGKQLLDEFAKTALTGDTIRKSVAFFLAAAKDAGIKLSPYFSKIQSRSNPAKKVINGGSGRESISTPKITPKRIAYMTGRAEDPPPGKNYAELPAQDSLLLWGLFQRLPAPGTPWPQAERTHWLKTLESVLAMEYPERN